MKHVINFIMPQTQAGPKNNWPTWHDYSSMGPALCPGKWSSEGGGTRMLSEGGSESR